MRLHIKRLTDLGFSLSKIAAMGETDDRPEEALRTLDAELAASIERLQRARVELGLILRQPLRTDLPPEFAPVARAEMSDADRSLITVMTRVLGSATRQAYADMLQNQFDDPVSKEFDTLPADADEQTRQDIAERWRPTSENCSTSTRTCGGSDVPMLARRPPGWAAVRARLQAAVLPVDSRSLRMILPSRCSAAILVACPGPS